MKRWYFWVLAPVMLATGIGLPFIIAPPTWQGQVVLYAFCCLLLLATLGLAVPSRFLWALRGAAALVLLAYLGYAATEAWAWWHGKPFGFGSSRGRSNLFNALRGLLVFGVPSLYLLLKGRSGTFVDAFLGIEDDQVTGADSVEEEIDRQVDDRSRPGGASG
jgi:hypothetical protein